MAGSHGRELWFDTDLGDEYIIYLCICMHDKFIYSGSTVSPRKSIENVKGSLT